ncbi:hypothetical protein VUR80DRAFT_546 [Thermomyces stellatus]
MRLHPSFPGSWIVSSFTALDEFFGGVKTPTHVDANREANDCLAPTCFVRALAATIGDGNGRACFAEDIKRWEKAMGALSRHMLQDMSGEKKGKTFRGRGNRSNVVTPRPTHPQCPTDVSARAAKLSEKSLSSGTRLCRADGTGWRTGANVTM